MFIKELNNNTKEIKVAIPLTGGKDKTRIKQRNILNEYGIPVSTKSQPFTQSCYVEWQIGYDVVKSDLEKLSRTTLRNFSFAGANGKEKTLYELSEYIYYFYKWDVISATQLIDIKNYLSNLTEDNFLDTNPQLSIKRSHPISKTINGFNFMSTMVEYPLLIYKFGNFQIVAEIKIAEKQYAIGTQPMLYLCFPITELASSEALLGRTARTKETADFIVNSNNLGAFLEMFKLFGTLSANHRQDVITIIDVIMTN